SGEMLWSIGTPDPRNGFISFDLPVQIYDVDGDGASEVIAVIDHRITILSGLDGHEIRSTPIPATLMDSLFIVHIPWSPGGFGIVVKNRYTKALLLDGMLRKRWIRNLNTGHYPHGLDVNGDGTEEILLG